MAKADIYGIEPPDRDTFNQLLDWWRRQSPGSLAAVDGRSDDAVPIMLLDAPNGWTQGRYCPMMIDSQLPFSYDVCLIGYPSVFELGAQEPQSFKVAWQGVQSQPIPLDATAVQFRAALPRSLRDICKVTGGTITDIVNGQEVTYRPGRWFVSIPAQIPGLEAVTLRDGVYDALVLRVSQSVMACGTSTFPCWSLVNRTTAPRIATGSLALGWYVQAFGLMVGVVEPRIYETYANRLTYPTTTTTAVPTTTTTAVPTTTTEGPPTTTTTSLPTTTTTGEPTTTTTGTPPTTTTTTEPTTTTDSPPTTTTSGPTTTTGTPPTTTTSGPTTTTDSPPTTTTLTPPTTTTLTPTTTISPTTTESPTTTSGPTTTTIDPPPTTTTGTPTTTTGSPTTTTTGEPTTTTGTPTTTTASGSTTTSASPTTTTAAASTTTSGSPTTTTTEMASTTTSGSPTTTTSAATTTTTAEPISLWEWNGSSWVLIGNCPQGSTAVEPGFAGTNVGQQANGTCST